MKILLSFFIFILAAPSLAAGQWYKGEVTRIWQHNAAGDFIITMDPPLDFCTHKYAYFVGTKFGAERLDSALSIVLSALHTGMELGVVINQDEIGPDGRCYPKSLDIRKGF